VHGAAQSRSRRTDLLAEHYLLIREIHVAAALTSGSLFGLRATAVSCGARWPMAAPLRYVSYAIDTALLAAALALMAVIHQYPLVDAWLTVKVAGVLVYIVLGSFALKRARSRAAHAGFTIAAIACFVFIVTVAVTHSPLGALAWLAR
jgi:uncharacterized membrane protein SirB2